MCIADSSRTSRHDREGPHADVRSPQLRAQFTVKSRAASQALSLPDLFKLDGQYSYGGGTNPRAIVALVAAIVPVVPGFVRAAMTPGGVVPNPNLFDHLYTYAWFVTFALSAVIYLALMPAQKKER